MKSILTVIAIMLLHVLVNAQTAESLYEEGIKLKKQQKISEALVQLNAALKLKPNYTDALYASAWCYNDIHQYDSAITNLNKVALVWSLSAEVFFERGYSYEMKEKYSEALDDYFKARELNPDYTNINKSIGNVYYFDKKYSNAILYYEKHEQVSTAATLNSDYLYWYRRGYTYNVEKKYEKAIESLNKSLKLKSDYLSSYLELGFAYFKLNNSNEAIAQYQKAIDINPKDHVAYNGMGNVYRDNIKDCNKAIEWYSKTLKLKSDNRNANYSIGYCLNSNGNYAEAKSYLKTAIATDPTSAAAYTDLGYSEYMLSNYNEAILQLNKALDLNANSSNALYYKGLVYIAKKDKQNATAIYEKLNSITSSSAQKLKERIDKL